MLAGGRLDLDLLIRVEDFVDRKVIHLVPDLLAVPVRQGSSKRR
jgi:hypothetical protein